MIELTGGNILDTNVEALVNTVNCLGVMGKGIALQFKQAYPDNYEAYRRACERHEVQPGKMLVYDRRGMFNPRYIINFPTKRHWRGKSRIEDIELGLPALVEEIRRLGITSVAVPPLGCGSGGLKWAEIRPLIERALAPLANVRVLLFAPHGAPDPETMRVATRPPAMTLGRAVLLGLFHENPGAKRDASVAIDEVHAWSPRKRASFQPSHIQAAWKRLQEHGWF